MTLKPNWQMSSAIDEEGVSRAGEESSSEVGDVCGA